MLLCSEGTKKFDKFFEKSAQKGMFDINRHNCRVGKKPDKVYEKKQPADNPEANRFLMGGQAEYLQSLQNEVDSHQDNHRK